MSAVAQSPFLPSPAAVRAGAPKAVAGWLLVCCAMVFAMVVVGGVTRLTHSGLSIVEWQPIVGTLPPLTEAAWMETFAKYQATPEYRLVNHDMTLEAFKGIFWWEYFHRLLGRTIGLVFALPLAVFALAGRIDRRTFMKLAGVLVLGGLQGAMGWYMVKSGLVDDPRVSQFRLTAHLTIAFAILASMLWIALDLLAAGAPARQPGAVRPPRALRHAAWCLVALVAYMVITGGFVAGIRAGKAYNSFPLMNGHVVPPEILMIDPWWKNFFYNMATVQFDHRLGAWAIAALLVFLAWRMARLPASAALRVRWRAVLAVAVVQVTLGITTLLLAVPVALGAMHQGGAVLLFAATLVFAHRLRHE